MKILIKIAEEWNKLENDIERWKYVINNNEKIRVVLDNDETYAAFCEKIFKDNIKDKDYDDAPDLINFDNYVGNSLGIPDLLSVIGIESGRV